MLFLYNRPFVCLSALVPVARLFFEVSAFFQVAVKPMIGAPKPGS